MKRPVLFGKYLLLARISVGGMAEVFQAKSFGVEGFEKIIAIKRILPSMAEDKEFVEMFIDEAKIAGQLSHANICQIYELGKIDNSHFIAMEYVWGKDTLQIQNRFRRLRRRMPVEMACYIASKACEGLDYAHRKRDANHEPLDIIHRDVSPQNILCSYEGDVKIIDFGIAKAVSRSSKTQAGVLKGKFGYMSPEQVRGLPLDRRSDIFALGTLLWEMCVGERLFTGETDFAILEKVRNAEVPPPSSRNPMVKPELEEIILKALSREAEDRYEWATEMQEELMGFLLSQNMVFTAKNLGTALKEMFGRERTREAAAMEEYKRIRRDDLEQYRPPAGKWEMAVSLLGAARDSPAAGLEASGAEEEGDGATEIGAPALDFGGSSDGLGLPLEESSDGMGFEDSATQIYGEIGATGPLPAEPTFIFNAASGQLVHAPDQATVILTDMANKRHNGGGAGAAKFASGPTVIFDAAALGMQQVTGPVPMGPASGTMAVEAPRSSLARDILIGVLLATVLILGVVLWKVFERSKTAVTPATVVVSTTPPTAAQVMIDGKSVGTMVSSTPFTRELEPGTHNVAVVVPGHAPLVETITVEPGQVRVVPFTVAKMAGHLALRIEPKEGTQVFVDGAEVSAAAAERPLELTSGRTHEIRVAKQGFIEQRLSVRLRPGQRVERAIELKPSEQEVSIRSDPAGAAVLIDGKRRGVTPLKLTDLPPSRYRVNVTLTGYRSKADWLVVEQGKPNKLFFRLEPLTTEGADGDSADPAARPKEPRTKHPAVVDGEGPGYLVANSTPWAKVLIDDKDTGRTTPIPPRSKIPLEPGTHKVTFVVGSKRFDFSVKIVAGKTATLIETLPVE